MEKIKVEYHFFLWKTFKKIMKFHLRIGDEGDDDVVHVERVMLLRRRGPVDGEEDLQTKQGNQHRCCFNSLSE